MMTTADARALLERLKAAFDVSPNEGREKSLVLGLVRMPLEVGLAVVAAVIDAEDRFPTVAALNRHAKTFGWEPERPSVTTVDEREMMAGCRSRFREAYQAERGDDKVRLEYYGMLGAFRWAVRAGTFEPVRGRLGRMGEQAQAVAHHVDAEVRSGKVDPAIRQEGLLLLGDGPEGTVADATQAEGRD